MSRIPLLERAVEVKDGELRALLLSFLYFFSLLCGYEILRPIRDAMGIRGSWSGLSSLFTATFVTMLLVVPLYSALVSRFPRHRVIPLVYRFFLVNLLSFFALTRMNVAPDAMAKVFYVWLSVYNLFVVSVFWSFMEDLFDTEQGKRLFGFIAAGGTAGTLVGPALTKALVDSVGPANLMLVSAGLLELCAFFVIRLHRGAHRRPEPAVLGSSADAPVGGGIFTGFLLWLKSPFLRAFSLQTALYAMTSTFLYFQQARLIEAQGGASLASRSAVFADIELKVNIATLALQVLVTGRVLRKTGVALALALPAAISLVGFVGLAIWPALSVLVLVRAFRSAAHYAFERPAKELLFTSAGREARYKSKNFIDTVIYRGSDFASSRLYTDALVKVFGLAVSGTAIVAVPIAAAWGLVAVFLARRQEEQVQQRRMLEEASSANPI